MSLFRIASRPRGCAEASEVKSFDAVDCGRGIIGILILANSDSKFHSRLDQLEGTADVWLVALI